MGMFMAGILGSLSINLPGHLIPCILFLPWQVSHLESQGCKEEGTEQVGVGLVSHHHPQAAGKGQLNLPQGPERS